MRRGRGEATQFTTAVVDQTLDNLCESIGEHRAAKNLHTEHEQADIQAALTRMQEIGKRCVVYKHAGVELARVPGAEQLQLATPLT